MSELGTAIEGVRAELAGAAGEFMTDLCDLVIPAPETNDGYGGTTPVPPVLSFDVPCTYKALGNPMQKQIGGGAITTLTHAITMPSNEETKLIRPHYQIVIEGHDGIPQMTFEQPFILSGSFAPFIKVAAALA